MAPRDQLPPPTEWMTVVEWATHVGESVSSVRGWILLSIIPSRAHGWREKDGRRRSVIMIRAGTRSPLAAAPPDTGGKKFLKHSSLCFSLHAPELAENRTAFAKRLERLALHLAGKPGDLKAAKWMLRALEGHHTTVGLARLLEIPTANLISLKRTGRTPPAIDDRMQELASALVERLRAPVAGAAEPLEYYADARLGDPWEGK